MNVLERFSMALPLLVCVLNEIGTKKPKELSLSECNVLIYPALKDDYSPLRMYLQIQRTGISDFDGFMKISEKEERDGLNDIEKAILNDVSDRKNFLIGKYLEKNSKKSS